VDAAIDGRSPIHYASDYGQLEVIHYLISRGADVNVSRIFLLFSFSLQHNAAFFISQIKSFVDKITINNFPG